MFAVPHTCCQVNPAVDGVKRVILAAGGCHARVLGVQLAHCGNAAAGLGVDGATRRVGQALRLTGGEGDGCVRSQLSVPKGGAVAALGKGVDPVISICDQQGVQGVGGGARMRGGLVGSRWCRCRPGCHFGAVYPPACIRPLALQGGVRWTMSERVVAALLQPGLESGEQRARGHKAETET